MYMEITRALPDPVRFTLVVVHTDGTNKSIAHIIPSVCTTSNVNRTESLKARVISMYISFLQFLFVAC
jgi:hypothetical protein